MAEKGNKRPLILGCLVVMLVLALAAGVIVFLLYQQRPNPEGPQQPSQPKTSQNLRNPPTGQPTGSARELVLMTWNVRGYPEKDQASRSWFTAELAKLAPDVLCIQEIADQAKVSTFMSTERRFTKYVFTDSPDGQDNAIFGDDQVEVKALPAPTGFQHPAEAAYVTCGGFDAAVVTVHLSWTDKTKREHEKGLLKGLVAQALKTDPDVIVCGDFNTEEPDISALASSCGLKVLAPSNVTTAGTTHAGHRYDWILITPNLEQKGETIGAEIVTFSGSEMPTAKRVSDHLPVRARFRTDESFRDRQR